MLDRDQNLLFGIIAIQLRLATPARFIDIAAAWSIDPARSIPERMVEAGVLTEEKRQLIDRLVEEALRHHHGDAKATLSSFGGEARLSEIVISASLPEDEGRRLSTRLGLPLEFDTVDSSAVRAVTEDPGRYTRKGEFSRGGMGRILLVHDAFLSRDVALKELLPDFLQPSDPSDPKSPMRQSAALVVRFLREARITGQLEHPSIVPVYELGRRPDGGLYYTMKLVRGQTLSKALKDCYSIEQRLRLLPHFIDLCQAVAYAHNRNIVHRDIKPSNTMIGEFGETVVIDWGLAKVIGREDLYEDELRATITRFRKTDSEPPPDGHTQEGERLGTPDYMAPEQALGQIEDIDPRSDVFSLGAVLYEILTGRPPFRAESTDGVLYNVIVKEPASITSTEGDVPPELEGICFKALKKLKAERYASAKELAEDLARFQAGALVGAYRYSSMELARRFYRRNRAVLHTAAAALVLLAGFGVYSYRNILLANESEREQRGLAEEARDTAEDGAYVSQIRLTQAYIEDNNHALARETLWNASVSRRNWEWGYLLNQCTLEKFSFAGFSGASYSQDGKMIVTVSKSEPMTIWDTETGAKIQTITEQTFRADGLSFSPDGKRLAGATGDNIVRVWDIATGKLLVSMRGHTGYVEKCRFSPDGSRVISASQDHTVRIWDGSTGAALVNFTGHTGGVYPALMYPDGKRVVSCEFENGGVKVWDAATGAEAFTVPGTSVDLSADGTRMATINGNEGTVWDAQTGIEILKLEASPSPFRRVRMSPDGTRLAMPRESTRSPVLYDATTGRIVGSLDQDEDVGGVSFSADSQRLLTFAWNGTIRIWDAADGRPIEVFGTHAGGVRDAGFGPEGTGFYTASFDPSVKLWEAGIGSQRTLFELDEPVVRVTASGSGNRIAVQANSGMFYVLDTTKGEVVSAFSNSAWGYASHTTLDADGRRLVAAFDGFSPLVIDVGRGTVLSGFTGHQGEIHALAFSPDGSAVASGSWDHTAALWNPVTGQEILRFSGHTDDVNTVAFSPDGTHLATGSGDGTARLWDTSSGALLYTLAGHGAPVRHIVFSPDGKQILSASDDATARLWDSETGAGLSTLRGHTGPVALVAFDPEGERILTSERRGGLTKVWQASSGQELITLARETASIEGLSFDSTGRRLITGFGDGRVVELEAAPWRTSDFPGETNQSWDVRFALYKAGRIALSPPIRIEGKTIPFVVVAAPDILADRLIRLRDALGAPAMAATFPATGGLSLIPGPALDALKRFNLREDDRILRIDGAPLTDAVAAVNALDTAVAGVRTTPAQPVAFELLRGESRFLTTILTFPRLERTVDVKLTRERATEILNAQLQALAASSPVDLQNSAAIEGELLPSTNADAVPYIVLGSQNKTQDQYFADAGMAPPDRIVKVNGEPVNRFADFVAVQTRLKEEVDAGRPAHVEYEIERGEFQRIRLTISIE